MSGIFEQTPANRRRYGVAIFVGIIAGLISAFVKWGAEHPFPPRSPIDFFAAACKVDITGLSQDQILQVCSRAFLNPPHVFLRDYLGIDPTQAAFTFADHGFDYICVHYITFPALGLTPPVAEWPLYEHISELVGHIFWFWTIEIIRRDLRNRITREPDAEIPLKNATE